MSARVTAPDPPTVRRMNSDPATFVALTALILAVVLAVRLRSARGQRRAYARRLAQATGHPSASGMGGGWGDRRILADQAAHHLAGMGLVAEQRTTAPIVRAQGAAGDYVLTIATAYRVIVEYESGGETVALGEFPGVYGAVREVAAHAERPATV